MFGVGLPELGLIFLVALLVFGPEKLPEFARGLGKLSADLRKATDAVRREFYNSVYTPAESIKSRVHSEVKELRTIATSALTEELPKAKPAQEPQSTAANESLKEK